MSDNETHVIYRAIADFSALTREARQARRELRELRAEEARLNASSAASSAASTRASNDNTRAVSTNTSTVRSSTQEVLNNAAATRHHAAAADSSAASHGRVNNALGRLLPNLRSTGNAYNTATGGANRLTRALTPANRQLGQTRTHAQRLAPMIKRLDDAFDKLGNWRPHLIPPFIALVPIIAGLLGLINPLVAGLGAVGGAAIGFASSLGRVAGAAVGVIPALFSLLSVVGALKIAFGGIGGAFKAFSKTKTASGGGGGGGSGSNKAELTRQEKITRAQEAYRRSIQNVKWAEEDLSDARKDYIKRLKDLQKAVDRTAMSEARAAANSRLARENYANILADPGSTKGQKLDAKAGVDEAIADQNDLIEENKANAAELAEMKKKGMSGDRQVIQATRALTDAINAQRDAQLDLINAKKGDAAASGGGASAANDYQDALDKLSPSARKFVKILTGMYDAWKKVTKATQEAFFSEFVDDVERLRGMLPAVQSLLTDTAGALGRVVDKFLLLITSPEWKSDLILLGKGNVPIIENIGDGMLDLIDAFKDITVIAQPFFESLTKGFKQGASNFREMISDARKSGSLAKWLEDVRESLSQWWRIVKNVGKTIFNYSSAAADFGDWITSGLEKTTEGWLKNSEKALGPGSSFRKWLEDIKPLLSEIKGLFGDFWGWIKGQSSDSDNISRMTDLISSIRDDLGPAIGRMLDQLADANVGQKFVDALAKVVDIIAELVDSGATQAFFDTLLPLLDFLKWLVSNPVTGSLLKALASGLGLLAAVTMVYKFTGLSLLVSWLLKLNKLGGLPGLISKIGGAFGKFPTKIGAPTVTTAPGGGTVTTGGAAGTAPRRSIKNPKVGKYGTSTYAPETGVLPKRGINPLNPAAGRAVATTAGKGFNPIASIGKGALKSGLVGMIAGIASQLLGDLISSSAPEGAAGAGQRVGGSLLGNVGGGAALGAGVGAMFGGVGAIPGAVVGGLAGGAASLMGADPADLEQVGSDISKWWNEGVIPAFTGAADSIGKWWNEGVVTWFQDRGTDISTWWETSTKPLSDWAASVGQWWDTNVGQPMGRLAGTIQEIWELRIVPVFTVLGTFFQTAWNTYVVKPFQTAATAIQSWWNNSVVRPFQATATQVGSWWNNSVVRPFQAAATKVQGWWNTNVVKPFQAAATKVQTWWNNSVVKPFQAAATKVQGWWNTNVVKPFQTAASKVQGWWDANVVKPFQAAAKAIQKTWDDATSAVRNFNPIEAFNKWLRNTFNLGSQDKHNGGVIHRAGGGGVPGSGNSDTVHAMLTPGEFVVRKAIVNRVGLDNLTKFNSGVMSYTEMLRKAMQAEGKPKEDTSSLLFGAGGLVPSIPGFGGTDLPGGGSDFPSFSASSGSSSAPFIAGDLVIQNPTPEPASDSLPRSIRKVAYLGSKR